uniref:protein disulfide-isomerase n=1 Tax=Acrobeloides nanus TaxID=290746 RepID=A0A914DWQ0_9BILA
MGMKKTEKQHFAGGNTDWEERKLGKFATSETRFVESMEYTCKKDTLEDSTAFEAIKEIKFKCHSLAEEHEDTLEKWFFSYQTTEPDLEKWLCIDELRKCCSRGHFGPLCQPCPGVQKSEATCFGRGKCQGDGTRGGTGKCECDRGYVGVMCSNCDAHFFARENNATFIECEECFDGCASGCTSAGPKGCRACRSGYVMDTDEGCKDVDECADDNKCIKEHEECVNLVGSFRCACKEGYRRNSNDECELDIEEKSNQNSTLEPEMKTENPEAAINNSSSQIDIQETPQSNNVLNDEL